MLLLKMCGVAVVPSPGCPSSPPKGLRRRLGVEGIRCLLSSFSLLGGRRSAILHDTFLGGVLLDYVVPLAVPGINAFEAGSSCLWASR